MAAKKDLFFVGDFAEDFEVMVPFQAPTEVDPDRETAGAVF